MASNRRLVPMPPRRKPVGNGPALDTLPTVPPLQVQKVQQPWLQPGRSSTLKEDAPYIWAFLALAAFWYFLAPWFYLALIIAVVAMMVRGWLWLSFRFPLTMYFINRVLAALIRGGRR